MTFSDPLSLSALALLLDEHFSAQSFFVILYRFIMYVFFGLTLETMFSVIGIEKTLGIHLKKRTPHKYLEGFVSLYMIPLHGLGVLFLFEPTYDLLLSWNIPFFLRYIFWALTITSLEALYGAFQLKTLGFYTWDYYKESRFKVFPSGLTTWTLLPHWGFAGAMLELYTTLHRYFSPHLINAFNQYIATFN